MDNNPPIELKALNYAKKNHKEVIHPSIEFFIAGYTQRDTEQSKKEVNTLSKELILCSEKEIQNLQELVEKYTSNEIEKRRIKDLKALIEYLKPHSIF
ncbi:hypothetical protein HN014_22515 (plasmid) [Aquimarina sp. TRL1]|uniref:hypothetical protein n=1 Tax=Aquimarina sp. (strain TRL1) TaxID=2736252 RepID=UPI00158CC8D4|nr:hypothetical protein [Aquimarina sp. TRL1]QKX07776.1 hypothetical protein HN014_22515 [Aquimarina sp. TRL1]